MPAPQVIVIAGPNGAGKSTLAPALLRDVLGVVDYVNADTIARGLSAFSPEKVAFAAGRIMLQQLQRLAAAQATFAFETTLATRSYAPWLRELVGQGYTVQLLYLWLLSPELAVERVQQRVRQGGHDVPALLIRRRYHRGVRNFLELYSPLAHRWAVFDNSAQGKPMLLATGGADGACTVHAPTFWAAFREKGEP